MSSTESRAIHRQGTAQTRLGLDVIAGQSMQPAATREGRGKVRGASRA
jgi:hypothetical protein